MKWIEPIVQTLSGDSSWKDPEHFRTGFGWKRAYEGQTKYGFKFQLNLSGTIMMFDRDLARRSGIFDETGRAKLLDDWYQKVFVPTLGKLQRFFEIDFSPPSRRVHLCGIANEDKEDYVAVDAGCQETVNALSAVQYSKYGCRVELWMIKPKIEETLMLENYDMLKQRLVSSPENDAVLLEQRELLTVVLWERYFELQREFQNVQSTQQHESKAITVTTKLAGCNVGLSWRLGNYQNKDFVLRGYRSESGFTTGTPYPDRGQCIVETQQNGTSCQHLQEGKEYFYTFLLTTDSPVFANDTLVDTVRSVVGNPKVKRVETRVFDSLHFMVRLPTQTELLHVDRMLERSKEMRIDPKREKINRAMEKLTSFVEFEESISEIEKVLVERINNGKGSAKAKRDKIEQLRALAGSLQVQL